MIFDLDFVRNAPLDEVLHKFETFRPDPTGHLLWNLLESRVIIGLSGGMDTTLLAAWALERKVDVQFVLNYFMKFHIAYDYLAIRNLFDKWPALKEYNKKKDKLVVLECPAVSNLEVQPGVMGERGIHRGVAEDEETEQGKGKGPYVYYSGFKALMYGTQLSYGAAHGYDACLYGYMYEQNGGGPGRFKERLDAIGFPFPDELPATMQQLQEAWQAMYHDLTIPEMQNPLAYLTKADVVALGERLNVPWKLTNSCGDDLYFVEEKSPKNLVRSPYGNVTLPRLHTVACGKCASCKDRKQAFAEAESSDPCLYDGEWDEDVYSRLEMWYPRVLYSDLFKGRAPSRYEDWVWESSAPRPTNLDLINPVDE